MGRRSTAHLRKSSRNLSSQSTIQIKTINGFKKSSKVNTLELDQGITVEANLSSLSKRWVSKNIDTRISEADITTQLEAENSTLRIIDEERIRNRNNIVTTVTSEGSEAPANVNWKKEATPNRGFHPESHTMLQVSKVLALREQLQR